MQEYWDRMESNRDIGRFASSKDNQSRAPVATRPQVVQKATIMHGYSQQHRRLIAQGPGLASTQKYSIKGQVGQRPRLVDDGPEPYAEDVGTTSAATESTQGGGGYSEKYLAAKRPPVRPDIARKSGIPRPSVVRRPAGTDSAYLEKAGARNPSANVVHRTERLSQSRRPAPYTSPPADNRQMNGEDTIAQGYRDHYLSLHEEQEEEEQEEDYEEDQAWYDDEEAEWQMQRAEDESAVPCSAPAAPVRRVEQQQRGEQGHGVHRKGSTDARMPVPPVPTAVRLTAAVRPTPRRPSLTRHEERPSLPPRQAKDNGEERDLRTETPETIIGHDTKLRGDLVVTGLLRVDGYLEGDQVCANAMLVSRGGTVQACVRGMECVFVEGTVVGDISATRVHLFKQGTVHGNLTCVSLQVEAGSMISGQANVGDMKLKQTSRM